jgi:hypothetical protein
MIIIIYIRFLPTDIENKLIKPMNITKRPQSLINKIYENARKGNIKKKVQNSEDKKIDDDQAIENYRNRKNNKKHTNKKYNK